jgi:hypothetical protein
VVLSCLFPDSAATDDLVLLCGADPAFRWRVLIDIEGSRIRVSRGLPKDTVQLDELGVGARSSTVAVGAADVQAWLGARLIRHSMQSARAAQFAVCAATGPGDGQASAGPPGAENSGFGVTLVSHTEFLEGSSAGASSDIPDDPGELAAALRRARLVDALDAQRQGLQERLDELERRIDVDGEAAELDRNLDELQRLPEPRELTTEEAALLASPGEVAEAFERRSMELESDLAAVLRSLQQARPNPLLTWIPVALGVAGALALTLSAVFGGREQARWLFVNAALLAVSLVGGLRWIDAVEASGRVQRKVNAVRKRLDANTAERQRMGERLAALKRDYGVNSVEELDRLRERRAYLTRRVEELRLTQVDRDASSEQGRLRRARQVAKALADELSRLRGSVGDQATAAFEIERRLAAIGVDPVSAIWSGAVPDDASQGSRQDLAEAAALSGLAGDGGPEPELVSVWSRVSEALLGRAAEVSMSPAGTITIDQRPFDRADAVTRRLVIEAFRVAMAILVAKRTASAAAALLVRVHLLRHLDAAAAARVREFYAGLSGRFQVIAIEAGR